MVCVLEHAMVLQTVAAWFHENDFISFSFYRIHSFYVVWRGTKSVLTPHDGLSNIDFSGFRTCLQMINEMIGVLVHDSAL